MNGNIYGEPVLIGVSEGTNDQSYIPPSFVMRFGVERGDFPFAFTIF